MKMLYHLYLTAIVIALLGTINISAQVRVKSIYLDKKDIFDSTKAGLPFVKSLANSLHTTTKDYVIEDELLFSEGEELYDDDVEETERNLRSLGLFSSVKITVDTLNPTEADITITTQDQWTTLPAVLFSTGGGIQNYGAQFKESNVAGMGSSAYLQALYRTENTIGWQGWGEYTHRKFLRSPMTLNLSIFAHQFRTEQFAMLEKRYLTLSTPSAYGAALYNSFGKVFVYSGNTFLQPEFHVRSAEGWFSLGLKNKDRLFASVYASVEDVRRASEKYRQAFDNSGKFLIGFSSLSQRFSTVKTLNSYYTEDLPIGAYGGVVFGRTFPLKSAVANEIVDEGMFYAGGQIEQSAKLGKLYVFGQLSGGSGFASSEAKYTYQEFYGKAYYPLGELTVVTAQFRQQTAWNWNGYRQLILDTDAGLRGYAANQLTGANRIIGNVEARFFSDWELWTFRFSGVGFYDMGSVWKTGEKLTSVQFHHALGVGVRLHNTNIAGSEGTLRFDFAYNADAKTIGFIFNVSQLFSAFGKHGFKLPEIFGLGVDTE
jgi:YD repeat-containing protein